MFINGKKINKDNIMNVANNIIRLKSDVQTRFNTLVLDYTPSIPELAEYKDINSDYDIIRNVHDIIFIDLLTIDKHEVEFII